MTRDHASGCSDRHVGNEVSSNFETSVGESHSQKPQAQNGTFTLYRRTVTRSSTPPRNAHEFLSLRKLVYLIRSTSPPFGSSDTRCLGGSGATRTQTSCSKMRTDVRSEPRTRVRIRSQLICRTLPSLPQTAIARILPCPSPAHTELSQRPRKLSFPRH